MAEDLGVMGLVSDLKKLCNNEEAAKFAEGCDTDNFIYLNETSDNFKENASDELKALMDKITFGLDEHLICDNGYSHYPNQMLLYRHGFRFYKGESDSFGPVTSVIGIPNVHKPFRIVYG